MRKSLSVSIFLLVLGLTVGYVLAAGKNTADPNEHTAEYSTLRMYRFGDNGIVLLPDSAIESVEFREDGMMEVTWHARHAPHHSVATPIEQLANAVWLISPGAGEGFPSPDDVSLTVILDEFDPYLVTASDDTE